MEASNDAHYDNVYGSVDAQPRLKTALELGTVACVWIQEHLHEFSTPFLLYHGVSARHPCVSNPESRRAC